MSTFAGDGTPGYADGAGTTARFNNPADIKFEADGSLLVADYSNNKIRRISPSGTPFHYHNNMMMISGGEDSGDDG